MVGIEEEYEAIETEDESIPNDVVLRVDSAVQNARQKSADDFEICLESNALVE